MLVQWGVFAWYFRPPPSVDLGHGRTIDPEESPPFAAEDVIET